MPNHFSIMSKYYIHADYWYKLIFVQEKRVKYHFLPRFSIFFQQWPLKLGHGHKMLFRFSACPSVIFMQILVGIKVSVLEILGIISLFERNLAYFFSAVTFKTRSRLQNLIQIFSMPKCCIHGKFWLKSKYLFWRYWA